MSDNALFHPVKPVLLGLCPIGKFVFSHEAAVREKRKLQTHLKKANIAFVDLDEVLPDGMIRDQKHVAPAVAHFRKAGIDALFLPHCNFGTEGAAGMIAKECNVPTLLWGPRDEAPLPDGSRERDSLCGLLASSKVLHLLRVPFSYILNTPSDHPTFTGGLERFVRVARMVKTLKTMRIGQVGQRIDFFWSTILSESDLLQRFGVQVQPIDLASLLAELHRRVENHTAAYQRELSELEKRVDCSIFKNRRSLLYNFALRDRLVELAREHDLDGFCIQSFFSIQDAVGSTLALGVAMLNDLGYPVGPEGDLHGAISSALLEAAATPAGADARPATSFLADVTIRHPQNDNAVLLWHTEAALSLAHPQSRIKLGEPWILKGLPPGLMHMRLKDGPLTLCRFDGDSGGYELAVGQGRTVEGPSTQEFYTWMEVEDWPAWERALIQGPFIHHCSFAYEHCADVLEEAARFLPQLRLRKLGNRP